MEDLRTKGISAAISSALFLGMAPVFGKRAIQLGASPLSVVTVRTVLAALLLLLLIAIFKRQYLYIYPAGILGCVVAGVINGIGSLFYYSALGKIGAGIGQLLYSLYPLFVALWLFLDRQSPSKLTLIRLAIALPAVILLTQSRTEEINMLGVVEMLIGSALYALHLPINQRVLYDMPAPTVTVYTLLAMAAVVVPAYFIIPGNFIPQDNVVWWPMLGLTMVTLFSRLTLFLGVKHLGGMQTAILGLSEVLVTILMARVWLGEMLNLWQWFGAILLCTSLLLVGIDKSPPEKQTPGGWLSWLSHPTLSSYIPWNPRD